VFGAGGRGASHTLGVMRKREEERRKKCSVLCLIGRAKTKLSIMALLQA
jgi:hypothetical protein